MVSVPAPERPSSSQRRPRGADGDRVAGCMIVRDEERFVRDGIASLRRVCDSVIVVDTGSTDDTPRIAAEHADRLVHFAGDGRVDMSARATTR